MKYRQNTEIFSASLDEEVCIFNPANGEYINLNKTASKIWELIEQSTSIKKLVNSLNEIYEDKELILETELIEFLEKGMKKGFIISN